MNSLKHLVASFVEHMMCSAELKQLVFNEPRDFTLGTLHRHLIATLDGQIEFPFAFGNWFTGRHKRTTHRETGFRIFRYLCERLLQFKNVNVMVS